MFGRETAERIRSAGQLENIQERGHLHGRRTGKRCSAQGDCRRDDEPCFSETSVRADRHAPRQRESDNGSIAPLRRMDRNRPVTPTDPGAQCALVAGKEHHFGLARMLAVFLVGERIRSEIFTTIREARRWLTRGHERKQDATG